MANKFQKSVQERLEQEAARSKESVKSTEKNKLPIEEQQNLVQTPSPSPQEAPPVSAVDPVPDVSAYLRREPQRQAKNKTFYLDGEVIEAIKATARAQQVTDSKLVNDILRQVLGV